MNYKLFVNEYLWITFRKARKHSESQQKHKI